MTLPHFKSSLNLKTILICFLFCLEWGFVSVASAALDEGIDYARIEPAQPTANPDKIEIVELFWYGCPHCFSLEPHLTRWLAKKADDIEFIRIPAGFNAVWLLHAKTYYVAQELGVLDKIHQPLFEAIHSKNRKLDTLQALADFFAEQGVNKEAFYKAFNHSFFVHTQSQRSTIMPDRYGITGVPALIVNGQYRLTAQMAGGSNENLMKILDEVIARVRQEKIKPPVEVAAPVAPAPAPQP